MSNRTFDVGSLLERLVEDRRFQIGGLVLAALVFGGSLAAGHMDVGPKQKRKAVVTAPEVSPNVPIIRFWPYPNPAVVEARAESLRRAPVKATTATRAGQRVITARR
jgi:hypothetical protein